MAALAAALLVTPMTAAGGQVILDRVDQGFYFNDGSHDSTNEGYIVGESLPPVFGTRNFFVFDIPSIGGTILGAELRIFLAHAGYLSGDPAETYEVYDVSTPVDELRAGGTGLTGIYDDLGSGIIYGNIVVTQADELTAVKVPLNATFTGIANSAAGGMIALGGALTSLDFNDQTQEQIFAKSGVPAQLVLLTGATPTPTRTATPAPTSTPTLTASPQPTATIVLPPHVGDPDAAKATHKCAGAVTKSAAAFVAKRRKVLETCAQPLFACLQTKEAGTKRDACMTKAGVKCSAGLATTEAGAKLAAAFAKACGQLAGGDLLGDAGLAFSGLNPTCNDRFGVVVTDAASAAACVRAHHECTTDQLVGLAMPRARELIENAGIVPPPCLPGGNGSGLAVGDLDVGKTLDKCQKAIEKASATFAAAKVKKLQGCLRAVLGCVQLRADEQRFPPCLAKAHGTCDKVFTAIDAAATAIVATIDKKCAGIGVPLFSDDGIDLDASGTATICAAHGVAAIDTPSAYETCLFRQHECLVEDSLALEIPRANELLGLVGRDLRAAFCPPP